MAPIASSASSIVSRSGQFFEGAEADIPPAFYLLPIVVAVMVLPLLDLAASVTGLMRK